MTSSSNTSKYQAIEGGPAFANWEIEKLKALINVNSALKVVDLHGQWIYYAHLKTDYEQVKNKLWQLLSLPQPATTRTSQPDVEPARTQTFYITPRTMSPWSSQATSIAQVCGLGSHIHRIERGRQVSIVFENANPSKFVPFRDLLHDRMTEVFSADMPDLPLMFSDGKPRPLEVVDIMTGDAISVSKFQMYNNAQRLGLDQFDMDFFNDEFRLLGRAPYDIELFMFAQINSEHCRHKQFNSNWTLDGEVMDGSLFQLIQNTHKVTPQYTVSAYSDNAAVLEGAPAVFWAPDYSTGVWTAQPELLHILAKVETHNHPTAISPFPGAATGSGGEIRDEGAVGRGSMPKAGLCGFWVSELLLPGNTMPWEIGLGRPAHYASSLDIMLEAPIGSARFNNEFGRPCLAGCFRTFLAPGISMGRQEWRGYHKPIMIAGGVGTVREQHCLKKPEVVHANAHVIVLGGPAMLIGLGGGSASSSAGHEASADLDFDSVQRGNPEMERRAQMVINTCIALGQDNPIAMIHDVGAGGLSNAVPELVRDAGYGGNFELRQIESADSSMSPLQIWCNEAQERYVLLVNPEDLNRFASICKRERCGFSDIGTVASQGPDGVVRLVITDRESPENPLPVNVPMSILFPKTRKPERTESSRKQVFPAFDAVASMKMGFGSALTDTELLTRTIQRVFSLPSVGSKSFLITIGDRSVGGLVVRDQMVGPWQTPVADVAVTLSSFSDGGQIKTGEAMAMGERPILALISPSASVRMAVAESLMNLVAASVKDGLQRVKLSANWMAAINHPGDGSFLYEAVKALGRDLCPKLGLSIPVGKDSLSMMASWKDRSTGRSQVVVSPVTAVISAFTVVDNARNTWTPQLRRFEDVGETLLMYVDLAKGKQSVGGSALAQVFRQIGTECPDVRDTDIIIDYFDAIAQLHESGIVLAYHDVSDGGLITTVAEMMFAGRCGVDIMLDGIAKSGSLADVTHALFHEELSAVFQIRKEDEVNFLRCFATCGPPPGLITKFGGVNRNAAKQTLTVRYAATTILTLDRKLMQSWWAKTSYEMQKLRDNPACAEAEYATIQDDQDPGLSYNLTFDPNKSVVPLTSTLSTWLGRKPRVAILREQGVNGHAEMAFAFHAAGFDTVDIHMSDIIEGRSLADFVGLAACGGFSYGDVLGGGQGWAKSILLHEGNARPEFEKFFKRSDTFTLGVCNGCQLLVRLRELIPGTEHWPLFLENTSHQFEARTTMVQIIDDGDSVVAERSVFLHDMSGSTLPIVVSHGEGRATFATPAHFEAAKAEHVLPIRYVDNRLNVTTAYPYNPNGSPDGIAAVKSKDGKVLAMMPHPERTIMADVGSYKAPGNGGGYGPWIRLFQNARRWVG